MKVAAVILAVFLIQVFCIFSCFSTSIKSTVAGGIFEAGYQPSNVTFSDGDVIRGHVIFKNGFGINNSSIVTWDAQGIVNGPITSGNNTAWLSLAADLRLGNTGVFVQSSSVSFEGNGKTIFLNSDMIMNGSPHYCSIATSSSITIDGLGHSLVIKEAGFLGRSLAGFNSNAPEITLRNMHCVLGPKTSVVYVFQQFSKIILENMTLCDVTPGHYVCRNFVSQQVVIKGDVFFEGAAGTVLNFGATDFIIEKNSTLHIGPGVIVTGIASVTLQDRSSRLHLNGCDFYTNSDADSVTNGLALTKGSLFFENKVRIFNAVYGGFINTTNLAQGFILGDGENPENDVEVRVLGSAYVVVNGCMQYNYS